MPFLYLDWQSSSPYLSHTYTFPPTQDEVPISLTGNSKIIPKYDIYDMFLKTELHVFRAIEPSLKFRYKFKDCNPLMAENLYQECIARQTEGLASRRQLAQALFEYNQQQKETEDAAAARDGAAKAAGAGDAGKAEEPAEQNVAAAADPPGEAVKN